MRGTLVRSMALAGSLAAAACGGTSPSGLALSGAGNVVITVGTGVTPTISWTGGNARRLTVTRSSGGGVFWDIEALNPQGIAPPVVHGIVPNTARENSSDVQLTQGTDFRVNVTLVDGSEGTRVFRP